MLQGGCVEMIRVDVGKRHSCDGLVDALRQQAVSIQPAFRLHPRIALCSKPPPSPGRRATGKTSPGGPSWRSRSAEAAKGAGHAFLPRPGQYGPGMDSVRYGIFFSSLGPLRIGGGQGRTRGNWPACSRGRFNRKAVRAGEGRSFGGGLPGGVGAREGP